MRELLERWSRVEPKRCFKAEGRYGARLGDSPHWFFGGPASDAIVLGAVIEAVEAHALRWNLWRTQADPLYTSQVWPDNDKDLDLFEGDGATPAAALLSAYLDALDHLAAVDEYGGTR